jgi:hypothetical protein
MYFLEIHDPSRFIFPLLKFLFIFLILIVFYRYFIKPVIYKRNRGSFNRELRPDDRSKIKIEILRDKINNPFLINLIVQNTGKKEIELNAPVLVFKSWARKRRFRILSVDFSDIYPMLIMKGKAAVIPIDLKQFYRYDPGLKKASRMGVEIPEVDGPTFKSRTFRLKWW